jgi:hypothetical protein
MYLIVNRQTLLSVDDKLDHGASRLMTDLEKIDDDLDKNGIIMVKMAENNEKNEIDKLGIDALPAIVFYDNKFPTTYTGKFDCTTLR